MSNENIQVSFRDGVRKIVFNRPQKRNAISRQMYITITNVLNEDALNDKVVLTIITGNGDCYSSGNDLSGAMEGGIELDVPKNLVQAFIDYPKLIIAVVNGPAIGIAATTVALCDIVYASNKACFDTPFLQLGLCSEGTSSYMFPRILGRSKASEALLLSKRLSAEEAYKFGLVSEIVPHENLDNFIERLYKYGSLPVNSVKVNKQLIMQNLRNNLTEINKREFECLKNCLDSEEFGKAMVSFMQRKSKL